MSNRSEELIQHLLAQTEHGGLVWTRDTDTQAFADSKDGKFRFLLRRYELEPFEAILAQALGRPRDAKLRHILAIHPYSNNEVQPKPTIELDELRRPDVGPRLRTLWSVVQDTIDLPPGETEQVLESILNSS